MGGNNVGAGQSVNLNQAPTQPVAAHAALNGKGGSQGLSPAMCVLPMSVLDQANVAHQDKGKAPEKHPAVLGAGIQKQTGRIQPAGALGGEPMDQMDQSQDDGALTGDSQTISLTGATSGSGGKVTKLVPVQPKALKLPGLIHTVDGQEHFSIAKTLLDTQIAIPFGQLLDKSDAIWKELAYLLQSATPWFRR